jgi:ABC-type transporter Mla MlaB component
LGDPHGSRAPHAHAPRPPPEPNTTVLVLGGRIARGDIPALCECIRGLLQSDDARPVVCDVGALVDPDAVTVDALARLQLTARRLGRQVRLRGACGDLQGLLRLTGLSEVLPIAPELPLEPRGQPEEREQARRVEEEADPGDPTG